MKRPMLVSGIALSLLCVISVLAGIVGAIISGALGALVLILYFIKPLKLREKIIIPAVCLTMILGSLSFSGYYSFKVAPLLKYDKDYVTVSGKVVDVPYVAADSSIKFTLKADYINGEKVNTKISVTAPAEYTGIINTFDYISASDCYLSVPFNDELKLSPSKLSDGTILDGKIYSVDIFEQCEKTPYYYCLLLKQAITRTTNNYLYPEDAGFLNGMLFGDKSQIPEETLEDFRNGGIAHLLAVSGLHTSLWCGFLIAVLKLFGISEKLRNLASILFLCCFCIISAFTPSVLRASLMMLLILLAPLLSKRSDALNSLGFAVTVLLLSNPYIITSISFQLSVTSTLGVLLSQNPSSYIASKTKYIKFLKLQSVIDYILENTLISSFAGIFTLPVSAYYFGVFSLMAPLTNLLCVKLAFWGMLSGFFSSVLSFIPFKITKSLVIFFFKITSALLKSVTSLAGLVSDFEFCTLPFSKSTVFVCIVILFIATLLIFIFKKSKKAIIIISVAVSLLITFSFTLPMLPQFSNIITVHSVGNGIGISVRSGLKHAYINMGTGETKLQTEYLPLATSESLDFVYISRYGKSNYVSEKLFEYSPKETLVTPAVATAFSESNITLPPNTKVSQNGNFLLNNKINFEITNTYAYNCVIIKCNNKTAMIYSGYQSSLKTVFESYETPDILVITSNIPESLPETVETLIISSDSEIIGNKNLKSLKGSCNELILTARKDTISWRF